MTMRILCFALLFSVVVGCAGDGPEQEGVPDVSVPRQDGFVEVSGGRLFFETAGSGEALVLIHGNAGDHRHWDAQMELAQEFQVVRYDVRGFGRSSLPVEGEPYYDTEDLRALLDHLGVSEAHVAGWSMGSGIAVDFALAFPERVKSLIPVGPWVFGFDSESTRALYQDMGQVVAALEADGQEAAVEAWMTTPFFSETITDSLAGEEFRRIASDYTFWVMNHRGPGRIVQPPAAGRTGEILVPTLIMTAEKDIPACLEIADLLDATIPDSRKVVMAGTGHLLHMEKPQKFNRQVLEFLQGLPRGG